jgi:hypothetical protein
MVFYTSLFSLFPFLMSFITFRFLFFSIKSERRESSESDIESKLEGSLDIIEPKESLKSHSVSSSFSSLTSLTSFIADGLAEILMEISGDLFAQFCSRLITELVLELSQSFDTSLCFLNFKPIH